MQKKRSVVILAAGKGTRLEPLTKTVPKPLIKVANIPIIVRNMESIAEYVDEYILVVGYMRDSIRAFIGESFLGKPVVYVEQENQSGTAHALLLCESSISNDSFFMLYGDDIYDPEFFRLADLYPRAIVGKKSSDWHMFGVLHADSSDNLISIVEKPKEFVGDNVNIGVYLFDKNIFKFCHEVSLSIRGEYELTDAVTEYCKDNSVKVVSSDGYWLTVGYPWHILKAQKVLMENLETKISGEIEESVVVKGKLQVGEGSVIKSGTYIDGSVIIGKNCVIGPHTYIRGNVVIGDNCKIGSSVEIEESSIGDKVNIEHLSFVGYSVLGNNIILGGGTVTADRRHDREPIRVNIKEQLVDTGMAHLGAIIGDHVRTGINTSIYPGRKLAYHSYTVPGEVVKQDKLSSHDLKLK